MSELLIGCGSSREKKVYINGKKDWTELTTLDMEPSREPDVIWNLNDLPLPLDDSSFDEIHAYEVLEHCGQQGDWRFFLDQWSDFYRIIKPGGVFIGTCPHHTSPWAWGDPSHTRIIGLEALTFLSQKQYAENVSKTQMSDFRSYYKSDWELISHELTRDLTLVFVLKAIK